MYSCDSILRPFVTLSQRLADAAAPVTLQHFRSIALETLNKEEAGFDPVTVADRGAEDAMRDLLSSERAHDGILGEEAGRKETSSGWTWVLDPIDGTRAYISGLPLWGTLIALDDGTEGRIGVIDQPFTGERFTGVIDGDNSIAWLSHRGRDMAITTRTGRALNEATVFTTDEHLFSADELTAFSEIRNRSRLTRYGTDCYAYALVAMGQIDLVIETGLQAYDIASHVPLIRAAGGVVTNWAGGDCRWGGRTLAAGSPEIHAEALAILSAVA